MRDAACSAAMTGASVSVEARRGLTETTYCGGTGTSAVFQPTVTLAFSVRTVIFVVFAAGSAEVDAPVDAPVAG